MANLEARARFGSGVKETQRKTCKVFNATGGTTELPMFGNVTAFRNGEVLEVGKINIWRRTTCMVLGVGAGLGGEQGVGDQGVYKYYNGEAWAQEHEKEFKALACFNPVTRGLNFRNTQLEIGFAGHSKYPGIGEVHITLAPMDWRLGGKEIQRYRFGFDMTRSMLVVDFGPFPTYAILKEVDFLLDAWNQIFAGVAPGITRHAPDDRENNWCSWNLKVTGIDKMARTANGAPMIHGGQLLKLRDKRNFERLELELMRPTSSESDELFSVWSYEPKGFTDGSGRNHQRRIDCIGCHLIGSKLVFTGETVMTDDTLKLKKASYKKVENSVQVGYTEAAWRTFF